MIPARPRGPHQLFQPRIATAASIAAALMLVGSAPRSADAGQVHEYIAQATIVALAVDDPASTGRLAAEGIQIGSSLTSRMTIDDATPPNPDDDLNPDTDGYPADTVSLTFALTGGSMNFTDFQRDQAMAVGLNQSAAAIPIDPFDGFGWAGSEPAIETGVPAWLAFNDAAESSPGAGDAKGFAVVFASAIGNPDLGGSTAIPTSLNIGNWALTIVAVDLLDETGGGSSAITVTAQITSIAVNPIALAPALGLPGIVALMIGLTGVGVFMSPRALFQEA